MHPPPAAMRSFTLMKFLRSSARFARSPTVLWPVLLFLGLTCIPIGIWWFLDARENVALHDLTNQQAINVEQQIQSILDTRLGLVQALSKRIGEEAAPDFNGFERFARIMSQQFP